METAEWIDEAQARCDRATPGHWRVWAMSVMAGPLDDSDYEKHVDVAHTLYRNAEGRPRTFDANFIAAAHQDLPRALAALRAVLDLCDADERSLAGRGEVTVGEIRMAILDGLNT